MKLYRNLRIGMRGDDVHGAKRAIYKKLARENGKWWTYYEKMSEKSRNYYGWRFKKHVTQVQKQMAIKRDRLGVFGQHTLDGLVHHGTVDHISKRLLETAKPDPALEKFEKLVASMESMSAHTPGYQLGGGHGVLLEHISPYQKLDCSSSSSKALYDADMFPWSTAIVSGEFARVWGSPGEGQYFTVYANSTHVFIRLHKSRWWRFDTSPHGDGGRGPRLRFLPRSTWGFTKRHWPGM
jgi:hypothetical protein